MLLQLRRLTDDLPDVGTLTLPTDQAEELGRAVAGRTEPVGGAGVEFDSFARLEKQVLVAEDQPQLSVEDVGPVVAFV
jgi:hypothetical protein